MEKKTVYQRSADLNRAEANGEGAGWNTAVNGSGKLAWFVRRHTPNGTEYLRTKTGNIRRFGFEGAVAAAEEENSKAAEHAAYALPEIPHNSLKRFFVGEDENVDLQVRITVLGPNDEDASGITPEETSGLISTESEETFALQIRDADDAAVFVGEPYRIAVMLEEALDKIREVIREQDEDSK